LLKPEWSPEVLLSANYLTHLNAIDINLLRSIGGWREITDGAQDWDVFLRCANSGKSVTHIPGIAYSWRQIRGSVSLEGLRAKPYADKAQLTAVQEHLDSNFLGALVSRQNDGNLHITWPQIDFSVINISSTHQLDLASIRFQYSQLPDTHPFIVITTDKITVTEGSYKDLIGPLLNPDVLAVGGLEVNSENEILDGPRVKLLNKGFRPLFYKTRPDHWGIIGSPTWYRNSSSISQAIFAIRKRDLLTLLEESSEFMNSGLFQTENTRLVSSPNFRYKTEDNHREPRTGELDDPYYKIPIEMLIEGPALQAKNVPLIADTYELQSEHFISQLPFNSTIPPRLSHTRVEKIAWLLPNFDSSDYGGIKTILRFAAGFKSQNNTISTFFIQDSHLNEDTILKIRQDFPDLHSAEFQTFTLGSKLDLSSFDLGVATLWTTAYQLNSAQGCARRIYLVQDYEPDFYPSGTLQLLAFESYRLNLMKICNTKGLSQVLIGKGIDAQYFEPGLDYSIFNFEDRERSGKPIQIFFYMRPGHSRNCFEMNVALIKMLKKSYGSRIEIICGGSNFSAERFGLEGLIKQIGLLPYSKNGDLYRSIDIGVSLMASSHPSYPTIEMMACGVALVTNYNFSTEWLFNNAGCKFVPANPVVMLKEISDLIEDDELRNATGSKSAEFIRQNFEDWDLVTSKFVKSILSTEL
jgi:glycosyltransferase involved in cell wall biosynthesis